MAQITPEEVMLKVSQGKPYVLLFLISGKPLDKDEAEANQLQMQHLAYLFTLEQEGKASVFGPMVNDERLRGIIVFNTANKEDVAAWMVDDPYIKGGYLAYELYDFFTIPGQQIINY
jgi:uncharacterized protein YciI